MDYGMLKQVGDMKVPTNKNAWIDAVRLMAALLAVALAGCRTSGQLSLWNDEAPAKKALMEYVDAVTTEDSPDFIPQEHRIAVFDLDGTLCCETAPTYFDWLLFEHRILDDKSYKATEEQIAAARRGREKGIWPELGKPRERMVSKAYSGFSLDEFDAYVHAFMDEPQPGFIGMKRGETFYRPMVEVVDLLMNKGFTVYVCSGTDRLLARTLVMDALPLPPCQIIGSDSTIVTRSQGEADGLDYIYKTNDVPVMGGTFLVKNLQMNKVSAIIREIGVKPVLSFGNTMSDASMSNYVISDNPYRSLAFMLLCDDTEREYGNMVKAEKMRKACEENRWIPVSMRDDWSTIYGSGVRKSNQPFVKTP